MNDNNSKSWHRLAELASRPYDLSREGALVDERRIDSMVCDSAGLKLLFATQRVTEEVLETFQEFAQEHDLVGRFVAMKRGAIVNRIENWESENRQALHTSSRDIFSRVPAEPAATEMAQKELDRLKHFLKRLESEAIVGSTGKALTTMINVGIGGSDLGPRSVYEALKPYRQQNREVKFIANVDPDDAAAVMQSADLERTLVNVVSKSGSTLETLTNETIVRSVFKEKGLDPNLHFIAVTGKGSPMDNPSNYLQSFYMFDYIGGRYSTTSMVGSVLLGFALGYERLLEFLKGAYEMDCAAEEPLVRKNVPLLLALLGIWNHNFLGYPTVAILPYAQSLHRFPAHLQQCDMESNGKSITTAAEPVSGKTGPIVWGEPGTNGQHAFYQLLHQGTEIVPAEFIGFTHSQYGEDIEVEATTSQQKLVANMLAQAVALAAGQDHPNPNKRFEGNRPSSIIIGERLEPRTMGSLLALYEAKIVFQGFAWDINSFDQEGVQLGKILANRFLAVMKHGKKDGKSVEEQLLRALDK